MTRGLMVLVVCCALGLLSACSEEPQNKMENKSTTKESAHKIPSSSVAPTHSDGRAAQTLLLLPEQPTARDCLQAIRQGGDKGIEFQWFINGEAVPQQNGDMLCRKTLKRGDQVEVRRVHGDDKASVTIVNSPPQVVEVSSTSGQARERGDIKVKTKVDDPDGDVVELQYRWLINGEPDSLSETDTLPGTRYRKGDTVQIEITPSDGIETGDTFTSIIMPMPNALPKITSKPTESFSDGQYVYHVTAADPDDDTLSYRLEEAPPGMTIGATGLIQWSTKGAPAGEYAVTVVVEDPEGGKATQKFSMTLEKPAP